VSLLHPVNHTLIAVNQFWILGNAHYHLRTFCIQTVAKYKHHSQVQSSSYSFLSILCIKPAKIMRLWHLGIFIFASIAHGQGKKNPYIPWFFKIN